MFRIFTRENLLKQNSSLPEIISLATKNDYRFLSGAENGPFNRNGVSDQYIVMKKKSKCSYITKSKNRTRQDLICVAF